MTEQTLSVDIVIQKVDYKGQTLSLMVEVVDGGDDRFECVFIPHPVVPGYMAAAIDYMVNVLQFTERLAGEVWNNACARRMKALESKEGAIGDEEYHRAKSEQLRPFSELPHMLFSPEAVVLLSNAPTSREFSKEMRKACEIAGRGGKTTYVFQTAEGSFTTVHQKVDGIGKWLATIPWKVGVAMCTQGQRPHINHDGEFQSDKYMWCKPGFVPLKLTDKMAQPVLSDYARRREGVDKEFSDDLETCLKAVGYDENRPGLEPVVRKGPFEKQYEGEGFGDVERNEHGARILYCEQFPADRVSVKFLDRKGNQVDPDEGADIWAHAFLARVHGHNYISESAIAYIELFNDDENDPDRARLDYSYCYSFRLPGGKKLADFNMIEVGYYNMELRGGPPTWSPGSPPPR